MQYVMYAQHTEKGYAPPPLVSKEMCATILQTLFYDMNGGYGRNLLEEF